MFARYSGTIVRITLDIHTNEIATLYIYVHFVLCIQGQTTTTQK
jgi:hypothetical protein